MIDKCNTYLHGCCVTYVQYKTNLNSFIIFSHSGVSLLIEIERISSFKVDKTARLPFLFGWSWMKINLQMRKILFVMDEVL